MTPSAKVIADSISWRGSRLTTIEATMHRFVLAEFNTHRAFSRNSASSRAIPVAKQIQRVRLDPAIPLSFPAEKPGMQGGDELTGEDRDKAVDLWLNARNLAVRSAELMMHTGIHKSVINRVLEPYAWHTVIVSSVEWENFWTQRVSPLAQPEMRAAAVAMKIAYDASTPTSKDWNEWHLPYIGADTELDIEEQKKVSVARCARVSYLTHDGIRDTSEDLKLYDRLVSASPPHASPLEHVARPVGGRGGPYRRLGNFPGWYQLRHWVES